MDTVQGQESREPDTIEMPASTVWPMVAALGVTLMGGGLVTHVLVSAVGLLLSLISAIGWWKDVLPQTRVEHVPLPAEGVKPVLPSAATVGQLTAWGGWPSGPGTRGGAAVLGGDHRRSRRGRRHGGCGAAVRYASAREPVVSD